MCNIDCKSKQKKNILIDVVGAVELSLKTGDRAEIDAMASKIKVQRDRLSEAVLKMTGR